MTAPGDTCVGTAAVVLVVVLSPGEGDVEQRIDVAAAFVEEAGGAAERRGAETLVAAFPLVAPGIAAALAIGDRLSDTARMGLHAAEAVLSPEGSALRAAVDVATRLAAAAQPGTVVVSAAARPSLPPEVAVREIAVDGVQALLVVPPARGPIWPRRVLLLRLAGAAAIGAAVLVIATRRRTPTSGERRLTLAVLQFKASAGGPQDAWIHAAVRDGLNTQLAEIQGVKVYSREFLDFLMSHDKIGEMEVATRLGVDKMLTGSVTVVKGRIRVDTQIVDVATGTIEGGFTRIGRSAEFLALESDVISGALDRLDIRLTEEERKGLASIRANSVEAVRRLLEVEGEKSAPPAPRPSEAPPASDRDPSSWIGPRSAWADDQALDRAAILVALEGYRRATEARDTAALAELYTEFPDDQRAAVGHYFAGARDLRVAIANVDIAIAGDDAVVTYSRTDDLVDVDSGRPMHVTMRVTRTLKRSGDRWKFVPR